MLEIILAAARFLHFACLTLLFGVVAFPLYAARDRTPAAWRLRIGDAALPAIAGALVSGVLWFLMTAAEPSGDLNAVAEPSALLAALAQVGPFWGVRLALLLATVAVMARPPSIGRGVAAPALAGALLASLALIGHAQGRDGAAHLIHMAADALHLLAAGAWIGGLVMLAFVLARASLQDDVDLGRVLSRFSIMAYVAVAALIFTGALDSLFEISGPMELLVTGYGRLLSVKLLLFVVMLALAGAARLRTVPAIVSGEGERPARLRRLRGQVLAQQALAVVILLIVAGLGVLDPGA